MKGYQVSMILFRCHCYKIIFFLATYALIYNFLKKRSHAKAAAAVKKAAKEASVIILKDNPEETEQDDLNQIVKAWKEKKSEKSTETSSSFV